MGQSCVFGNKLAKTKKTNLVEFWLVLRCSLAVSIMQTKEGLVLKGIIIIRLIGYRIESLVHSSVPLWFPRDTCSC